MKGRTVGVVRVGMPEPLAWPWNEMFRSAERVWTNLRAQLPSPEVEIVDGDPDVWLWDPYGAIPDSDRPLIALLHEAPREDQGVGRSLLDITDRAGMLAAERASRVVTCSSASRAGIIERYGIEPERIDLAPYGVDATYFKPGGPTALQAILDAGGDERPYILFVGTVLPRKNLPLLRNTMTSLPTHQLVLVASPCLDPDSETLLEAAVAPIDGRPVPNLAGIDESTLAALMRGADLLCLPSQSEGFGLPVAEAMACGTPVVVSDRGPLPGLVGDGGVAVRPTREDLVRGLREALVRREELAHHAVRRGAQLTWAATAEAVRRSVFKVVRGTETELPPPPTSPEGAVDRPTGHQEPGVHGG